MNVQVEFLETELALISVPIAKAPLITQPLIKLCLKMWKKNNSLSDSQILENSRQKVSEDEQDWDEEADEFFSITFTPHECSVICSFELVERLFQPLLEFIPEAHLEDTTYAGIKVDGTGDDSSTRRILDLSGPISKANIPIFFLSTYFSDYLLVPYEFRGHVERLLIEKGFHFSSLENSYVAIRDVTPPPSSGAEPPPYLSKLVSFDTDAPELILTGTRTSYDADAVEMAMVKSIVEIPNYFSITMHSNETSFILDEQTVHQWPENSLLGTLDENLIPVLIDLRQLPTDTVGVVATVSSLLAEAEINMSYLSTLHSSVVVISSCDLEETKRTLIN